MREYEILFALKPDLDESEVESLINRFSNIVNDNGGQLESIDKWGKRRLAYEIDHYREATYFLMNFSGDSRAAKEIDRVLRISDGVLRHLVVRKHK